MPTSASTTITSASSMATSICDRTFFPYLRGCGFAAVVPFVQTACVNEDERIARPLRLGADSISRRAGDVRHDRTLAAPTRRLNSVDFAHVWASDDGDERFSSLCT